MQALSRQTREMEQLTVISKRLVIWMNHCKNSLQELKASGLYDNSVIMIYGDHYGISENHNEQWKK